MSIASLFTANDYSIFCENIGVSNGIVLNGQLNTSQYQLNFYEHVDAVISWSGPYATNINGNASFTRIGNAVIATFIGISSNSTISAPIISAANIPADFIPNQAVFQIIVSENNSVNLANGVASISSAGSVIIENNFGNFQNSGMAGFGTFSICYSLN